MAEDPNFTKMSPEYKKRYREMIRKDKEDKDCLLYTSPSPRD